MEDEAARRLEDELSRMLNEGGREAPERRRYGYMACGSIFKAEGEDFERRCRRPEDHSGPHAGTPVR